MVLLCALPAVLLSGCGGASATVALPVLRIWYSTDDPAERVWSQKLARRFESSYPRVHVVLTDYSFADLNTKLQLALTAGNPPDLAYVTPRGPGIPAYVGAHRLHDLTSTARAHGWATELRPGLLARYNRPFASFGDRPGGIVAVPTSLAAVGILYNKRVLHRLHLSIPRSLVAFQSAAKRALAAGYTPVGIGNADGWVGDDWYLTLVNSLVAPSALEPEQQLDPRFSFRRPPYLQAARLLQQWSSRKYFTDNFGGLDAQEGIDQFFAGNTLFQLVSSSQNPQIMQDQRRTHLSVGVFAFPGSAKTTVMPVSGYLGWVVPAHSRHVRIAVQFIDALLTPGTAGFLSRQGLLPARRDTGSAGAGRPASPLAPSIPSWQQDYARALDSAQPGVYLDAAPIANLNATMEANVQLLLQGYEPPQFLVNSLEEVYRSHGKGGSTARIDGEF